MKVKVLIVSCFLAGFISSMMSGPATAQDKPAGAKEIKSLEQQIASYQEALRLNDAWFSHWMQYPPKLDSEEALQGFRMTVDIKTKQRAFIMSKITDLQVAKDKRDAEFTVMVKEFVAANKPFLTRLNSEQYFEKRMVVIRNQSSFEYLFMSPEFSEAQKVFQSQMNKHNE